jgi:hypothetical protein
MHYVCDASYICIPKEGFMMMELVIVTVLMMMMWTYVSLLKFLGFTLREKILMTIIVIFSPHVYFAINHPKELDMYMNPHMYPRKHI